MKKSLLSLSVLLAAGGLGQIAAENVALDGYYRIQNARDNEYVHVGGPFTVATNHTAAQVITEPGSVFYVKAVEDVNYKGEPAFRIVNLRSQGVEVTKEERLSYQEFQEALFNDNSLELDMSIVHNITKLGFDRGYVNVGRAALEFMIYFMGSYLDDNYKDAADADVDLKALTDDFITTVAENMNLEIYLEPVKTAGGADAYSLYYDVPDLQPAVDWYLNPANKERFEVGFRAMRKGLALRGVSSGEYFDPAEIAEMRTNGYAGIDSYLTDPKEIDGVTMYHVPYEKIFADKDLLFAWLKMNVIRLLDPERCPKISLKGIYLPSIGEELRKHRVTAQLISYLPRLNTGKRVYLISGLLSNGGVEGTGGTDYSDNGQFGFVSAESVAAGYVADAEKWIVTPIDNTTNYFAFAGSYGQSYTHDAETEKITDEGEIANRESQNGYWSSLYLDFPVKQPEGAVFHTLSQSVAEFDKNGQLHTGAGVTYAPLTYKKENAEMNLYYYELAPLSDAADYVLPRMTPAILINSAAGDCRMDIVYDTKAPVYTLENVAPQKPDGFTVKDEFAAIGQKAPAMRISNSADSETGVNSVLKGTLLPISTELLSKYGYDSYDDFNGPAYSLNTSSGFNNRKMTENTGTLRANEAFLVAPFGYSRPDVGTNDTGNIYIGMPQDDTATGIESVDAAGEAEAPKAVYDLMGRRVNRVEAGKVYIVDGKKVIAF